MKPIETIEFCKTLMIESKIITVSTIDHEGYPESRAMFNLKNFSQFPTLKNVVNSSTNPFFTLLATNTASNKVEELKNNPKTTIYYCIPEKFHGLTLTGTLHFREDMELKKDLWVDGWEIYYPQGYIDPDYTVLELLPRYARGWYGSGKFEYKIAYDAQNMINYSFLLPKDEI